MANLKKTRIPAYRYGAKDSTCNFAWELKRRTTKYEKLLWQRLRRNQILGLKFRRQHPIGKYIADFYCHQARLVVELDGPIHKNRKEYDENRTVEMERLGIKVIRFNNLDVTNKIKTVLRTIKEEAPKRLK